MDSVLPWLLEGDASVPYQAHLNLCGQPSKALLPLQRRISVQGFGAQLLALQQPNGHWDNYWYQPKWTSTHYTLLDLKDLRLPENTKVCRDMVVQMFDDCMAAAGGVNLAKTDIPSDICVDGMVLNYASYFCPDEPRLVKLKNFIVASQRGDGGFTWYTSRETGDPHSTICVLEGLRQYQLARRYIQEKTLQRVQNKAEEYLLANQLFIQADKAYQKLSYPYRYRYDILRALKYFANEPNRADKRLSPALNWLKSKRTANGRWVLENRHKGKERFGMEPLRQESRFITMKALYILKRLHFCQS